MILEGKFLALKRKITSDGFLPTVRLAIHHLVTRALLHRDHSLFYADVASYSLQPERLWKDITGRQLTSMNDLKSDEIVSMRDYAGQDYIERTRENFDNNWVLFLAYIDGQVAGGGWGFMNNSESKTKVVPLLDGDMALVDFWTIPQFRGRSVYPYLLSYIVNLLKKRHFQRAFGYAHEKNIASIRGLQKAGFKRFIEYESHKVFGRELVIWKPGPETKNSSN